MLGAVTRAPLKFAVSLIKMPHPVELTVEPLKFVDVFMLSMYMQPVPTPLEERDAIACVVSVMPAVLPYPNSLLNHVATWVLWICTETAQASEANVPAGGLLTLTVTLPPFV